MEKTHSNGFTITPEMYEDFKNDSSEMFCQSMTGLIAPPPEGQKDTSVTLSEENKKAVKEYIRGMQNRIIEAKKAIERWDFGTAHCILSEPYPTLTLD